MSSAKVNNRGGSFGSKRSRSDGSKKDGDWTCPKCGNINFSFRTVCNLGKCGAPRPPMNPSAPLTSPYNNPPSFYFGGVGVPPPMPLGVSSRYGHPIPVSAMHYDYAAPGSAHGPYGLLPAYPPVPLGGIGYGSGPSVNGYGYGFQASPWAGGSVPDSSSSRKRRGGPDGSSEGDWICPKCDNVNFAFRTTCNMKKCGAARPSPGPNQRNSGPLEGSWTCSKCDNVNYAFRTVCNRKGCENDKPNSAFRPFVIDANYCFLSCLGNELF